MTPFNVQIEVIPKIGSDDPASINKLRELKNSGVPGSECVESLQLHQLIRFVVDCANKEEAIIQVQDMCELLLVNPVLATGEITIYEA